MTPLRGSKREGYRSMEDMDCPHCARAFAIRGIYAEDPVGPHIMLYPVAPRPGEYDAATLAHVRNGPPAEHTGVALPRAPTGAKLVDDPVPRFDGSDS